MKSDSPIKGRGVDRKSVQVFGALIADGEMTFREMRNRLRKGYLDELKNPQPSSDVNRALLQRQVRKRAEAGLGVGHGVGLHFGKKESGKQSVSNFAKQASGYPLRSVV